GVFTGMRNGQRMVSTRETLALEEKVRSFGCQTRGTCPPLGRKDQLLADENLNAAQTAAVRALLDSCDRVQIFKGKAGVGKSRSLKALVTAIEENGRNVVLVAPTA